MARTLVSMDELAAALRTVQRIDIDGEQHVDGEQLLAAVTALTRGVVVPPRHVVDSHARSTPTLAPVLDTGQTAMSPLEAERARLAALPPGPCVGCKHPDHFGDECGQCKCVDYVDSVVRDPIEVARDRGDIAALQSYGIDIRAGIHGGPPHGGHNPNADLVVDPQTKRPLNVMFDRPPVN